MPRVAIIIPSCSGGGVTTVMSTLATAMQQLGAHVDLIVLERKGDAALPEGVACHFLYPCKQPRLDSFLRLGKSAKALRKLVEKLEVMQGAYDLVLSGTSQCDRIVKKADFSRVYYILHVAIEETLQREKLLGPIKYFRKLRWVKSLDQQRLIAVSQGIADEIIQVGRIHPKSIEVIYNPCNRELIRDLSALESDFPIPDEPYVIHIGRFARQKRHDVLFDAIKKLPTDCPVKFLLLSNHVEKLSAAAQAAGVADRVIIPPYQKNPFPLIKSARLLVLSSDYEGFGMVLVEALACGTPVVSTDCKFGPAEIMTGPLAHFLVPRRDPAALAEMIQSALIEYPPVAEAEILDKVSARTIARRYLALCQSD